MRSYIAHAETLIEETETERVQRIARAQHCEGETMPTFRLHVDTDNAAFRDDYDDSDYGTRAELARILRGVANRIESGDEIHNYRTILDSNGNDVGRFALKENAQ